jgi:hypothetical protein
LVPVGWLEIGEVTVDGNKITVCRLVDDGTKVLIAPDGWKFERSLSADCGFVAPAAPPPADCGLCDTRRSGCVFSTAKRGNCSTWAARAFRTRCQSDGVLERRKDGRGTTRGHRGRGQICVMRRAARTTFRSTSR